MCNSKETKPWSRGNSTTDHDHDHDHDVSAVAAPSTPVAQIDGRPVLQPGGNRVPTLERRKSLKKVVLSPMSSPPPPSPLPIPSSTATTTTTTGSKLIKIKPPLSSSASASASAPTTPRSYSSISAPTTPKSSSSNKLSSSPRPQALKRGNDPNGLNLSLDKVLLTPRAVPKLLAPPPTLVRKKSKKSMNVNVAAIDHQYQQQLPAANAAAASSLSYLSSLIVEAPGSIAAARREQVTLIQAQRKMKIAHYGRSKSANFERVNLVSPVDSTSNREKRCTFITPNSDPLYVTYHDEEWGVPVHDDKLLFEMLVLSGAQVGSDWTSILKKRQDFRDAFSGFDAEFVSKFNEKQITSISTNYNIELSRVRGVVDNSNRILEIQKEFGSFDKYLWGFVNHKPIATQYKSCHKIPVKTSKSETISKDMVRRGFRCVGPTVMHSFMQAAGLTNDHLITCPRHLQCIVLSTAAVAARRVPVATPTPAPIVALQ